MVNLSTPNDVLFRELMADKEKSLYWLKKKNGGEKLYEQMRNRLLADTLRNRKNCTSDMLEYRSANGNRWITYECSRYFANGNSAYTTPYAFCFYETLGSVGAFVPVKLGADAVNGKDAIVIFTSHFFYQMCERLKLKFRSPAMVKAFHEFIPSFLLKTYRDEEDNDWMKLAVRLPGSIGWGFLREGDGYVFEVRTFLADTQLNGKQRRITKEIREKAGKVSYEPKEVMINRMKEKMVKGESIQDDIQGAIERYKATGLEESYLQNLMNVNLWIVTVLTKMEVVDVNDNAFWERHSILNADAIEDYIKNGNNDGEKFLELLETCAKNDKLRKFNKEKARQIYEEEVLNVKKELKM